LSGYTVAFALAENIERDQAVLDSVGTAVGLSRTVRNVDRWFFALDPHTQPTEAANRMAIRSQRPGWESRRSGLRDAIRRPVGHAGAHRPSR